ncbi:MAG TPA: hypothetical protein VMW94_00870 [Actinomycetes bacterium]|nr:hypothetical protein [Actinomycetes bacterium]
MHVYACLAEFKDFMREQGSTSLGSNQDATMLSVLESASRRIDEFCQRSLYGTGFGPRIGTNKYDSSGGNCLWLNDDLITTTKVTDRASTSDAGTDITADTDYFLQTGAGAYGDPPYRRLVIHDAATTLGQFGSGFRTIDVVGTWGYPYVTRTLVPTTAEALDATEQEIDVSALTGISPGMTLLIEAEQVYVSATTDAVTDSITVDRGVNGTTAAVHLTGQAISRIIYHAPIVDACNRVALRRWRSRDAGADGMDGGGQVGSIVPREGEDLILRRTVGHLRLDLVP